MGEVWRGEAPARHASGLGKLSMASHLAIALEGLGAAAAGLGLGAVFAPAATARLRPYRIEIEMQDEARPGEALHATCAVTAADAAALSARFSHWRTADETLLAELTVHAAHVAARTGEAFAWPARVQGQLQAMRLDRAPPAPARPGGEAAGLSVVGRGMLSLGEIDGAGGLSPDAALARLLGVLAGGPSPRRCTLTLGASAGPGQTYRVLGGRAGEGGLARMVRSGGAALAEARFDAAPESWPRIQEAAG